MTTTAANKPPARLPTQAEASSAEFAVLGSCLVDPKALHYTIQNVDEDHFLDAKNKMLFKVFKRMHATGVDVDLVTTEGHFTVHEKKMLGISHLVDLTEKVPAALNVNHYARIMRNRAITVTLEKSYEKLRADPFNEETRKEVARCWDQLSNSGATVISLKEAVEKYRETMERRKSGREFRILTGYGQLDQKMGGLYGGNLIAVGARTSLGKTSLLLNFAHHFLKNNIRVLFVSAEMITDEILDRLVAMDADLSIGRLRTGQLHLDESASMNGALTRFESLPMSFLEGGKMSLSRLRYAVEATYPTVIFVDFIQRFVPPNPAMNRAAYFSDLANEFKAIAMERKIVVFAASQLNRDIEKEGGRPPQLSDFKESGGIEESADIAILLQAKKKEENDDQKKIILHLCKHRNGPTGRVPFIFKKARTMFFEEEPDPDAPPF